MPVSGDDRRRFQSQADSLRGVETDEEMAPEHAARTVAAANDDRARAGLPPLRDEREIELPEEGFYRRARALGLMRHSRSDT